MPNKVPPPQGPQLDLGKTLGLYDTASVREKVRKWNTTGAGVVTPEDAVPAESDKGDKSVKSAVSARSGSRTQSKPSSTLKLDVDVVEPLRIEKVASPAPSKVESKPASAAADEIVVIFDDDDDETAAPAVTEEAALPPPPPMPQTVERRPQSAERRPKAVSRLDAEVREAISPKKRVVSDGHWRRKRSPPKAAAPTPTPPPWPPKAKIKPDIGLAWVRPPLLPRKPDEPDPPPKPKPIPKPIKVYSGRPRAKSAGILRSDEDTTLERSNDEPVRVRTPTTPRPRRSPRMSGAIAEERQQKFYISDEDNTPKRPLTTKRRPSYDRALEDPYSSAEDIRRRKHSYAKSGPSSTDYNSKCRTSRRSPNTEDRHNNYSRERRSRRRKSSAPSISDEESEMLRKSKRRGKSVDAKRQDPESQLDSPPRILTNNDDEAAERRRMFLQEHAQFSPKETRSADRRRNRLRKKSYSPDPITPPPVLLPAAGASSRVPRVEAWLTTTPDPFLEPPGEAKKSRRVFSFEPQSRDAATEVSTVSTEVSTLTTESSILSEFSDPRDRRGSGKTTGKERVSSSKRSTDRHVRALSEPSEFVDDDQTESSSVTSVSTLRRKGAHRTSHTAPKGRMKTPAVDKSYTDSDVDSSAKTSSVDPSVFDHPDLMAKRMFPSTGKRLSTIASVETFKSKAQPAPSICSETSEMTALPPLPDLSDPSVVSASRSRASMKKKLASHADLISVLSMPAGASRSKSVVSARSIRTHRSRLETATLEDLMKELASDETKYMRELRTLADGVIPILLKCVLSKSDAAIAAGLFRRAPASDKEAIAEASKVIHDMSVAIQRLKGVHTSIPKDDHFKFLIWAQRALSIYEGYVKTWRMGFQDVVVSLANEGEGSTVSSPKTAESGWDQGLPRNEDGYIVDGSGERVDVAYLLKRPLVRLKFLTKTLKGINIKKPSEQAGILTTKYQSLMDRARQRVEEEKARMEDEAAALIDATRARDPKSLAPVTGVKIDPARCLIARDFFDLKLRHSSGQQVDCRVELLKRDDAPGRGASGDILICEIDETGRWLLFPPVQSNRISSRAGNEPGEIVVMIRGVASSGKEWEELLYLKTADEEIRFEWIQMLGVSPVPPQLERIKGFKTTAPRPASSHGSSRPSASTQFTVPLKSRTPSPTQVQIPIGEQAGSGSKKWGHDTSEWRYEPSAASTVSSVLSSVLSSERATVQPKKPSRRSRSPESSFVSSSSYTASDLYQASQATDRRSPLGGSSAPKGIDDAMRHAGSPSLRRTKAARYRSGPPSPVKPPTSDDNHTPRFSSNPGTNQPRTDGRSDNKPRKRSGGKGFSVWIPGSGADNSDESSEDEESMVSSYLSGRPPMHRKTSSVPSISLPTISKRKNLEPAPPKSAMRDMSLPKPSQQEATSNTPSKLQKKQTSASKSLPTTPIEDQPPPPPPHRTPSQQQVKFAPTPTFTPTSKVKRRSSSPLKHEYQPSSPSLSSEYSSEDSASQYSDESMTEESSADEVDDGDDIASSLISSLVSKTAPPVAQARIPKLDIATPSRPATITPPETIYSQPNSTLKPSESASQGGYRGVPQQVDKVAKSIAAIFCWNNERGQWQILHTDECSIVITPGLIQAFEMSPEHSTDVVPSGRPLISQELTPIVPLRKGTGLDITIRSPATPASKLHPGNNIMYRGRSLEEIEKFYTLLNWARINNPTYIALQNARPSTGESSWASVMDQNSGAAVAGSGSWWQSGTSTRRSKSYRASTRAPSTAGNTESSVGTMSSVTNAMKRLSGFGKPRTSGGSEESGGSGGHSPIAFVDPRNPGDGLGPMGPSLGITNAKCRLYVRQPKGGKWQDLGSTRLTIMQKELDQGVNTPAMIQTGVEKRIVVSGKGKSKLGGFGGVVGQGAVLLDVTLGESCFERVARTGIAVSVWEDVVGSAGGVAATGGVTEKRIKVYMIQMKNERDCAFTFSLLGKLRY
ncbi:hypothetical protein E2P81_ATG11030 [Venturia nashicola]|uniref:Uncharacterized protein n=1 Tax=Venturia nashicola TaxID=86259 RepID=A0A4Z1NU68_9PEZI|nr:hypothetical protein E6O75_ATG10706 [Venturia nashicola]TLD27742.1 hypothetical protein E2P81_ATG11030 [Venturia nashicola]